MILSFDWFWEDLRRGDLIFKEAISSQEFLVALVLSLIASALLFLNIKKNQWSNMKPIAPVFVFFSIAFILGLWSPIAPILINIYVLALGLLTIREGAKQNHLGVLNFGLVIITVLIACRFFDTDLSFVARGILFVSVGAGFFLTNYWMLKKRKNL